MKPWVSHKWVATPHTRTEKRWAISPREPRQNVVLHSLKYQNIDTGKFDSDKLPTLYHSSLAEMAETDDFHCQDARHTRADKLRPSNEKWFTPKDDDFDNEPEPIKEKDEYRSKVEEIALLIAEQNGYPISSVKRIVDNYMEKQAYSCNVKTNKWNPK